MRSPRRLFSGPVFPGRIVQGIHLPSISHWFHLHGRNLYKILDSCKQLTVSQSSGDDDTTGMVTIITGFQLEDPGALSAPMQVGRTAALRPGAPHGAASCLLGAGGWMLCAATVLASPTSVWGWEPPHSTWEPFGRGWER